MIVGRWITEGGVRARVLAVEFVTGALGSFVSRHACVALVALDDGQLRTAQLDGCKLVPREDEPAVSP